MMASVENLNPLQQTLREVKLFIPRSNILTAKGVLKLRKVWDTYTEGKHNLSI